MSLQPQLIKTIASFTAEMGQPHLSYGIETLPLEALQIYYQSLLKVASTIPQEQRKTLIKKAPATLASPLKSLTKVEPVSSFSPCPGGEQLIRKNAVACVLLAGGQASRLGISSSKGLFPIGPISKKNLFDLFFEKVKAACNKYNRALRVAVMLSPLNYTECERYFISKQWFGLDKKQVILLEQTMLPFLDEKGNFVLQSPGHLLEGPNGNGEVLHLLKEKGWLERFEKEGIQSLEIIPIDNPLANPFDPILAKAHDEFGYDSILKCCLRTDPSDALGIIALQNNKVSVVEYSEIDDEIRSAVTSDGHLQYPYAHTGLMSFSLPFAQKVTAYNHLLLHVAKKKATYLTTDGQKQEGIALKLEKFLFDLLDESKNPGVLAYPKAEIFAPLKTKEGPYGIKAVETALSLSAKELLKKVYHYEINKAIVEVDPVLYYPTEELAISFKGKIF